MTLLPLVSQTIVRTLILRCQEPLGHFLACTWCLSWAGREARCRLQRETHSRPLLQFLFASLSRLRQFDAGIGPILPAPSMSAANHHGKYIMWARVHLSIPTAAASCRRPLG